jgi:hypothetical protein
MSLNQFTSDQVKNCKKFCTNDLKTFFDIPDHLKIDRVSKRTHKSLTENDFIENSWLPSVKFNNQQLNQRFSLPREGEEEGSFKNLYKTNLKKVALDKKREKSRFYGSKLPYLNHKRYKYYQFVIEEKSDEENEDDIQKTATVNSSPYPRRRYDSALVFN